MISKFCSWTKLVPTGRTILRWLLLPLTEWWVTDSYPICQLLDGFFLFLISTNSIFQIVHGRYALHLSIFIICYSLLVRFMTLSHFVIELGQHHAVSLTTIDHQDFLQDLLCNDFLSIIVVFPKSFCCYVLDPLCRSHCSLVTLRTTIFYFF